MISGFIRNLLCLAGSRWSHEVGGNLGYTPYGLTGKNSTIYVLIVRLSPAKSRISHFAVIQRHTQACWSVKFVKEVEIAPPGLSLPCLHFPNHRAIPLFVMTPASTPISVKQKGRGRESCPAFIYILLEMLSHFIAAGMCS
jgi:hypothetical protein